MNNEQKLPLAEIKAGLKLAKEAYDVLANDTDYVRAYGITWSVLMLPFSRAIWR